MGILSRKMALQGVSKDGVAGATDTVKVNQHIQSKEAGRGKPMNAHQMINIRQYNSLRPVLGNKYERHQGRKRHEQETGTNFDENHALMDAEDGLTKASYAVNVEAKPPGNLVANLQQNNPGSEMRDTDHSPEQPDEREHRNGSLMQITERNPKEGGNISKV